MRRSISTVLAAIIAVGASMTLSPGQAAPVRVAPALADAGNAAGGVLPIRDWRDRGERGDWVYSQRRNWRYGPDGENRGHYRDRHRNRHHHHHRRFVVPSPFFYGFPFFTPPRHHYYDRHHRRHRWD